MPAAAPLPSSKASLVPSSLVPNSLVVVIDVTPMLPGGGNGGAKWVALSLIQQFLRQRPAWQWWLLTTAANEGFLAGMFPEARQLRVIDGQGQVTVRPRLRALPGGGRADLLFCPFTAPFHACLSVPTVSIVHDLQFAAYPQFFSRAEVEERSRHFTRAVTVCDRLVCVSDYVAHEVRRAARLNPRRVRFVHNTLVERLPTVSAGTAAAALAGLELVAGRYLLYPANTWPHKNHAMLITALGIYFAAHPESDLKLVCTGVSDDPRGRMLRDAVVRMGLAGRVLFPGFQDESCFTALVTRARALIFPSLFEGFGIPVLEAMAAGVPVLSANTTSLPEVCGDAALMFDPRRPHEIVQAIETIEGDPELAQRLAGAGRRRAAALGSATLMATRYLDIVSEVLTERRRLSGALRWRLRALRRVLAESALGGALRRARRLLLRAAATRPRLAGALGAFSRLRRLVFGARP